MDPIWTNLLSGFIGAGAGGLLALLGSTKATKDLNANERAMEADSELRLHRGAIRAILPELTNNLAALRSARKEGGLVSQHMALATTAYDGLLLPFFSLLPGALATQVAVAYGLLHTYNGKPLILATEYPNGIAPAAEALWLYATRDLKMEFPTGT